MIPTLVDSMDPRIDPLEARIEPMPEREHAGQHILFSCADQAEPAAYLHVMPLFWLGGRMEVVERSHWLYMARIASRRPIYFAALWRAWYAMPEFPALYPVSLITRPTPAALANTLRLGFAPDPWLVIPNTLTFHAESAELLPYAGRARKRLHRE